MRCWGREWCRIKNGVDLEMSQILVLAASYVDDSEAPADSVVNCLRMVKIKRIKRIIADNENPIPESRSRPSLDFHPEGILIEVLQELRRGHLTVEFIDKESLLSFVSVKPLTGIAVSITEEIRKEFPD